jgi:antitoxin component of MazEF toxin-antitoxin module
MRVMFQREARIWEMRKRLSRIGSSRGIILDRTLLGLLGVAEHGEVCLTVENRRLIVQPVYGDPLEELRARLPRDQHPTVVERGVRVGVKRIRAERLVETPRGR